MLLTFSLLMQAFLIPLKNARPTCSCPHSLPFHIKARQSSSTWSAVQYFTPHPTAAEPPIHYYQTHPCRQRTTNSGQCPARAADLATLNQGTYVPPHQVVFEYLHISPHRCSLLHCSGGPRYLGSFTPPQSYDPKEDPATHQQQQNRRHSLQSCTLC